MRLTIRRSSSSEVHLLEISYIDSVHRLYKFHRLIFQVHRLYKVHRLEISYRTIRRSASFTRFTVFYSYKVHRLEISYRFTVFWRSDTGQSGDYLPLQGSPSGDQLQENRRFESSYLFHGFHHLEIIVKTTVDVRRILRVSPFWDTVYRVWSLSSLEIVYKKKRLTRFTRKVSPSRDHQER